MFAGSTLTWLHVTRQSRKSPVPRTWVVVSTRPLWVRPPTSQNQAAIEADLRAFAEARLGLDDAELTRQCEQAIRNYDPCISCSAHFLNLTVERSLLIPNGRWFLCQVLAAGRSW
jgi:hypothetical protein